MIEVKEKVLKDYTFIDLFSGIGGFRLALESLGAKCVFSSEIDKNARKTYIENFNDVPVGDISKIPAKNIPDHDILCAGFPCQPFSISGKKLGFNDTRGTLFFEIARIVKEKKPKVLLLENVRHLIKHNNGETFATIKSIIEDLGYSFNYKILKGNDFNVPQLRNRLFMVCFRKDLNIPEFKFPDPIPLTKHIEDILLPEDEVSHMYIDREYTISKEDNKYSDKPNKLGQYLTGRQGQCIYSIKGVGATITTNHTEKYLINGKIRKLHPREVARIMGYPDTFKLPKLKTHAYKQLGNSVIVDIIQYLGIQIGKALNHSL